MITNSIQLMLCSPVRHMSLRSSGDELVTVSSDCVLLWDLKVDHVQNAAAIHVCPEVIFLPPVNHRHESPLTD